jgi:hypothetical protein
MHPFIWQQGERIGGVIWDFPACHFLQGHIPHAYTALSLACHQQLDRVLNLGMRKREMSTMEKVGEKAVGE